MNVSNNNVYKNDFSNFIKDNNDMKIVNLLNLKYDETYDIINKNKNKIIGIKELLFKNDTIYYDEIKEIFDNNQ